ncbi:MAG: transglutaminase domain-containing protein [Fibrobacteres bacterium]|nr:transglutaminase domain-containing protein [Fibrobacterota bacterium]
MSTRRERIVPALLVFLPILFLARAGSIPTLSVVALGALSWSVAASRPLKWRGAYGWLAGTMFAMALAWRLLDEHAREPWLVAGWFFASMAAMQAASWGNGARAGFLVWNSVLAMAIGSAGGRGIQFAAAGIQLVLVIGFLRGAPVLKSPTRSSMLRLASVLALAGVLAAGASWVQVHTEGRWSGSGRWGRHERSLMGFSAISRLGSFQSEYGNGGDEVAVRLYSDTFPEYLQGQVHAFYHQGSWIAERKSRTLASPRNVGDAAVFCRDEREPGDTPSGWLAISASTFGLAPLPSGTPCFAAVADSADLNGGGAVSLHGATWSRGIWWYGGRYADTSVLSSDRKVPAELEPLLDSALARSGREVGDRFGTSPTRRLATWFQAKFRYSLVVSEVPREDPLATFLRERTGYCEYFASLSVLMLRRQGIPARYVTGYAQPERTSPSIATFRRSNAHAWVIWRDTTGSWNVFDPTPASDDAFPARSRTAWLDGLTARWTLLWHQFRDGNWRTALDEPQRILDAVVASRPSWTWLLAVPVVGALVVFLVRRRRGRADRLTPESVWARELAKVESRLSRQGIRREPGETVGALIKRWPAEGDAQSLAFLERYQRERFGRGVEGVPRGAYPPVQ